MEATWNALTTEEQYVTRGVGEQDIVEENLRAWDMKGPRQNSDQRNSSVEGDLPHKVF